MDDARGGLHPRWQRVVGHGLHDLARERTLDGEHRVGVLRVADLDVEALGVGAHPGDVGVVVGGVRDGEEAVGLEAVA